MREIQDDSAVDIPTAYSVCAETDPATGDFRFRVVILYASSRMVNLAPRFDNEAGLDAFLKQSYPVLSGKQIEFLQMVATCANKKAERVFNRHAAMVFRATMGLQ